MNRTLLLMTATAAADEPMPTVEKINLLACNPAVIRILATVAHPFNVIFPTVVAEEDLVGRAALTCDRFRHDEE